MNLTNCKFHFKKLIRKIRNSQDLIEGTPEWRMLALVKLCASIINYSFELIPLGNQIEPNREPNTEKVVCRRYNTMAMSLHEFWMTFPYMVINLHCATRSQYCLCRPQFICANKNLTNNRKFLEIFELKIIILRVFVFFDTCASEFLL